MKKTILFVLSVMATVTATAQDLRLWYSHPAETWTDALPVGNSRMGAMVFGGVEQEELQLNEETFWAGGPHNNISSKGYAALGEIRQMVFQEKFGEAQKLIDGTFFTGQHGMRYLPLGSLKVKYDY